MKELIAERAAGMKNGEMRTVDADKDNKILLCRIDDQFYALSHTCPHYGAPLEQGVLSGERIICPWHHSCFNARSGDYMEPPSIQSLVKYDLTVRGDDIVIILPDELETARVPSMVRQDKKNNDEVLIIGGGAAGYMAAQTLREEGYTGKLRMISPEDKTPYDRPNLSKDYLAGNALEEWMSLRSDEFYEEYGIETVLNKKVTELHTSENLLEFNDGMQLNYSKLIIATGGSPVKLDIPGAGLGNIFYLRSYDNTDEIIKASENAKNIFIIGGSFIGMEAAFHLKQRNKARVTVVVKEDVPFKKVFGEEIGKLFLEHHRKNGIEFITGSAVSSLRGTKNVEEIILNDGSAHPADMIIAGIGVKPVTDFIKDIELQKDGSIKTDEHFCVKEYVYAVGDIASYPDWRTGKYVRIEHWRTAMQQGRYAAMHLSGKSIPYRGVPFFWTRHGKMGMLYLGHAAGWDEIRFSGNIEERKFIAFYIKDDKIQAAAGMNRNKEMAELHAVFYKEGLPDINKLKF